MINNVPRYRAIRARLPLAAVEPLAELNLVQWIRTADEAATPGPLPARPSGAGTDPPDTVVDTAKVNSSEGDVAHQADVARRRYGVDGAGIAIGVLSNGVRSLAQRQASGDLPGRVTVLPGQEGEGDEGTAMLEIVHDLAPGAELYFATGLGGQAQFAANMETLCEAGADVIVDDLYYFVEAVFQDGVVAQGINAAVDRGCVYITPAGNSGNLNDGTSGVWEGDYTEGSLLTVNGQAVGGRHDFGQGVEENRITMDSRYGFMLQWADSLGQSANDYDLFLVDADGNVIESSTNTQDGWQDPIEFIYSVGLDHTDANLVVVKVSGEDRYLRLSAIDGQLEIVTAGNIYGHFAAANAIAVAAVDAQTVGGNGVFNGMESVTSFSSDGPRRVFFHPDGTPITPGDFAASGGQLLQKPDIAAATCVSTATPGFSRFCGTSSAAPHAAAIAALMLEAAGGRNKVTVDTVRAAVFGAALDIEDAGIVMAPGAVAAVAVSAANRNRAPEQVGTLADLTLAAGAEAVTIDLAGVFVDPDNDPLTYTVLSSHPYQVEVTLSGSEVTLTSLAPGHAVVTVRATDPSGLRTTQVFSITVKAGDRDYDLDDDRLIEVANLAQLDAMRYDLDGNGLVDGATWMPYYEAFPRGALEMGCPDGCKGYELMGELDFDTNGNGDVDADDAYWNSGAGWAPIGVYRYGPWYVPKGLPFTAMFEGNGHTIANLFINRPRENSVGLFGFLGQYYGRVRNLGLLGVRVEGYEYVGSLAGFAGRVERIYATGQVSGHDVVGGLVGSSLPGDYIRNSYAAVRVSGTGNGVGGLAGAVGGYASVTASYATGRVSGVEAVGGVAGFSDGEILSSYATGRVSGRGSHTSPTTCEIEGGVGGLVGAVCRGPIRASFATGAVTGQTSVGGVIGTVASGTSIYGAYWDLDTSGVLLGVGSDDRNDNGVIDPTESQTTGTAGWTTTALQTPTDYEGIYATWNLDLGNDRVPDAPWDFGTGAQYPALKGEMDGDGRATWQEFGFQIRAGPILTATTAAGQAEVVLTWTAVDTSFWAPAPDITYTLTRDDGVSAPDLGGLQYTDDSVTAGAIYTYQVAVGLQDGEAARSARVPVKAGVAKQGPIAVGTLPPQTLRVGSGSKVVDVTEAFRDPEDDRLVYAASSTTPTIATVHVAGSGVKIAPVFPGRAMITVTATDQGGSNTSAIQLFRVTVWSENDVDYDTDDDSLIEIRTLAQLDAVRHDLNGDGVDDGEEAIGTGLGDATAYANAFPQAVEVMGCDHFDGCTGYELFADLDFDTNGNGVADSGDAYWNGGVGWVPIGGAGSTRQILRDAFGTTFEGNGYIIANLFVNSDTLPLAGLFGFVSDQLSSHCVIRHVGLIDVDLTGEVGVGGLVGSNWGCAITGSYATGRVEGHTWVGGLVGDNYRSTISHSYAAGRVKGHTLIGGLVGENQGTIIGSYATGRVKGHTLIGGLVGENQGTIIGSYATGRVEGHTWVGGLVGENEDGTITSSYWDTNTSGHMTGTAGQGQTTAELQAPTGYSGIYQTWNLDLDGDSVPDDPWDFGTSTQYPILTADLDRDGQATWQEFGFQSRDGSALEATVVNQVAIISSSGPDATYAVGDPIEIMVTFSRNVAVTGRPRFSLKVGDKDRTANYQSSSGAVLVFSYTVLEADTDNDGVSIDSDSLSLGGGTIRDTWNRDAVLDHEALADNAGHKVDGVKPVLRRATVEGGELRLVYNEALDESSVPPPGAFTLSGRDSPRTVSKTAVSWRTVILALDPAVTLGETGIRVSYAVPPRNPIRDAVGNEAERLTNVPATPAAEAGDGEVMLEFAHFANGSSITSDLVLVNVAPHPIRPAIHFYDRGGDRIAIESVVEITGDLELTEDGSLTLQKELEPQGELTISTHGQGEVVSGSVTVVSNGPVGGVLRFDIPGVGVAGVGAGQPVRDALFPARRQAEGISTAAAIRNLGEETMEVRCRLMQQGTVVEEEKIDLPGNGQVAEFIEEMFTATDTSDFVGLVHCTADELFTGVAVELDDGNRIFTTVPVVPVDYTGDQNKEAALEFAHFANGSSITSDLVLVNVAPHPIRPALYFYDRDGDRIAAESVVEVKGELEVAEDGALTVQSELEPLQELTISTHGQGEVAAGSVTVVAEGPLGGVLRFDFPGVGVAGVGAGQPLRDALFPARRQAGGISTAAAIRNLQEEELVVTCQLMQEGAVLEEVEIELQANGQDGRFIEEVFTTTDTTDFVGLVRCTAEGEFTGVAVELDAGNGIFTTLPMVPVPEMTSQQ